MTLYPDGANGFPSRLTGSGLSAGSASWPTIPVTSGSGYRCSGCGHWVGYYSNLPHRCAYPAAPAPVVHQYTLDPQIVILLGRLVAAVERLVV